MTNEQVFFAMAGVMVTLFIAGAGFFKYYLDARVDHLDAKIDARVDHLNAKIDPVAKQVDLIVQYINIRRLKATAFS